MSQEEIRIAIDTTAAISDDARSEAHARIFGSRGYADPIVRNEEHQKNVRCTNKDFYEIFCHGYDASKGDLMEDCDIFYFRTIIPNVAHLCQANVDVSGDLPDDALDGGLASYITDELSSWIGMGAPGIMHSFIESVMADKMRTFDVVLAAHGYRLVLANAREFVKPIDFIPDGGTYQNLQEYMETIKPAYIAIWRAASLTMRVPMLTTTFIYLVLKLLIRRTDVYLVKVDRGIRGVYLPNGQYVSFDPLVQPDVRRRTKGSVDRLLALHRTIMQNETLTDANAVSLRNHKAKIIADVALKLNALPPKTYSTPLVRSFSSWVEAFNHVAGYRLGRANMFDDGKALAFLDNLAQMACHLNLSPGLLSSVLLYGHVPTRGDIFITDPDMAIIRAAEVIPGPAESLVDVLAIIYETMDMISSASREPTGDPVVSE